MNNTRKMLGLAVVVAVKKLLESSSIRIFEIRIVLNLLARLKKKTEIG